MDTIKVTNLNSRYKEEQNSNQSAESKLMFLDRALLIAGGLSLLRSNEDHSMAPIKKLLGLGSLFLGSFGYKKASSYLKNRFNRPIIVTRTINRTPGDMYHLWRSLEPLQKIMPNVEDIIVDEDSDTSYWSVKLPFNIPLTWKAEITTTLEDSALTWKAAVDPIGSHSGAVTFNAAPGGRGSEVTIMLWYKVGEGILLTLSQQAFYLFLKEVIAANLIEAKQYLETGQHASTEGQSAARPNAGSSHKSDALKAESQPKDTVLQGSQDSFPASDAPAWIAGNKGEL